MLERHHQFGFVHVDSTSSQQDIALLLESRPGDGLGLLEKRRDIHEETKIQPTLHGVVDQLHNGKFGLSSSTVQSQYLEPARLSMALRLPRARLIRNLKFHLVLERWFSRQFGFRHYVQLVACRHIQLDPI